MVCFRGAIGHGFRLLAFLCLLVSAIVLYPRDGFSAPTRGDYEGNVLVLHQDDFVHKKFEHVYVLKTNTGRKRMLLTDKQARQYHFKSGDHIKIKNAIYDSHVIAGIHSETLALDTGSTPQTVTPGLDPRAYGSFGPLPTLVVLVNFSDNAAQPFTTADTQAMFTQVSNFFRENSSGQSWLTGVTDPSAAADVVGWLSIPDASSCDAAYTDTIADHADEAAAQAGVDLSQYSRKVYIFSPTTACYTGWGEIQGNRTWIYTGLDYIGVIEHEMGHNFGLDHSHSMPCTNGACQYVEYGDTWDTMGTGCYSGSYGLSGSGQHFNAYQKELLGWLDYNASPQLSMAGISNNYYISAYELNDPNPKGVKIVKSLADNTFYYVEYRTTRGFDQYGTEAVLVHASGPAADSPDDSFLWETQDGDGNDPNNYILHVGQTYMDAAAGVAITLNAMDSTTGYANIGVTTKPLTLRFVKTPVAKKDHVQKGFVWITAQIGNENGPYTGATVKFQLESLDKGKDTHGRARTDAQGNASLRVPRGSYRIMASSTVAGVALIRTKTLLVD